MENQNLRKRLYQNLSHRPLKHTFLLQTQMKDPKSTHGILKPKILQENIGNMGELKNLSNSFVASPNLLKSTDLMDKKQKPQKVEVQKLSKEAKTLVQDGKNKMKSNLKPAEIFAFYDAFPEMIEDFFYLNRLSHPYDYQIVSYAKRNNREYMTISSQGVTLYHDKQAEFLTRDQWLADEKIYHQLQKIDFFSQYKVSKNFMIWKNKMKRHYMKSMSNILSEKLFLTSEQPRKCLIGVRSICLNMEDTEKLLPSNQIQTYNWKQLLENINHYLSTSLTKEICKHEQQIISQLEKAINSQIKNFKQNNKIKIDGLNSQEENKEGYIYSQEAILRKQYKRVLKLIKLAESLLLESKINLFNIWLEQILQKLQNIKDSNFRQQWLNISFVAMPPTQNSTSIIWNPSYQNFINIFKNIIDKAIDQICKKHDKIMNHPVFEKYRNSDDQSLNKDDRHNFLKNLIEQSDFYYQLMRQIENRLEQEFQHVTQQGTYLKKYIEIYNKHKNMLSLQTIIKESTVAEIAIYVQQWKEDNQQMKDLADKCMGMIKFDFSLMRKQMMNVAGDSYTKLFALLPTHLAQLCRVVSEKASQLLKPLQMSFDGQKFVQYTKHLKRAAQNIQSISEQGFEIKRLEMLMSENKFSSIESHKKNLGALFKLIQQLTRTVIEAQIAQNMRLSDFKAQNEQNVKGIKASIKLNSDAIERIEVEQKNLSRDQIILKISQILKSAAEIDRQAININATENQLGLPETDFSESHTLYNRVKMLSSLWTQKKLWAELSREKAKKHYSQINYESQMNTWAQFNNQVTKIKQYLDQNQHLTELINCINDDYSELQLIKALQSKSLSDKQWKEISQYLTFEFNRNQSETGVCQISQPFKNPKNPIYTIEWLKKNKISTYKQRIELIVKNSEKQSYLLTVLTMLKTYINNLAIKTFTKKGDLNLLGDNSIVFEQLSEHLLALIQIFNNEYSQFLKKETKPLVKHYEYVIEILQAYRDFSANWEKYEELFDPLKHYSKQLSKESKDFTTLQTMWKKLSKNITAYDWSKKVYDETTGSNPNRNTMKLVYKANTCWQQIKKGVEEFLDRRRNIFNHYYYFSDDELLSLMKKLESNPGLNSVIPIIYENIRKINVDANTDALISVVNKDGQQLKITKASSSKTGVDFEDLLKNYEQQWKKSLIGVVKKVIESFISSNEEEISREKIVLENVSQVGLAFENIIWVKLAEETYLCSEPVGLLSDWISIQNTQISDLKQLLKRNLTGIMRKKIELILIQLIYLRDKTQHFAQTKTQSLDSYEWQRTLRLCDGTGSLHQKIYLKAIDSVIYYGGQFLGLTDCVYIAPETERSYLNIIQLVNDRQIGVINSSYHNTSLIKSFSSLVAQNFRQFSFCEGANTKMIARVLSGICSQGLWSCIGIPSNWQIISCLASYLTIIEKCLRENTYNTQINKHSININQNNLPVFFIKSSPRQDQYLKKISKLNYRHIEFITPNIKTILGMHLHNVENGIQIADIISEVTSYCQKLFQDQFYHEFGLNFAFKLLQEMKIKSNNQNIVKKIQYSLLKILGPRLKEEDMSLLQAFVKSFNYESEGKLKRKKSTTYDSTLIKTKVDSFDQKVQLKYGQKFLNNVNNLEQVLRQCEETGKNIVVVGPNSSGKTSVIQETKNKIQKSQKRQINLSTVYFMAYKDNQLMSGNDKSHGIIPKCLKQRCENWVVLDGPLNQKYLNLFGKISHGAAISNHGVISNGSKTRFLLETTNLSKISPDFISYLTTVYVQESEKHVEEIIKGSILSFLHKEHQESARLETKGDENTQIDLKVYRIKEKPIKISKQLIEILISQIVGMIEKLAPRGSVKIKLVQMLYEISASQLATKCAKLVECVFIQNWDSINEKVTRKCIEKFAVWVVLWSISTVVSPHDYDKLEKAVSQVTKSNLCEDILQSIVFPGSGLEIYTLSSQRAQNSLSSNCGTITNIVNKYELLMNHDKSLVKNKFEPDFYYAEPNKLRVITEQTLIYSYFATLNSRANIPIALYGPQASGKKSNIDVFNNNYEHSIESYLLRFKKHDPYFIGKQIQRPFNKLQCPGKLILKPYQIWKRIHVSIDDVSMTPYHEPSTEFLRMIANTNSMFDDKLNLAQFRQMMLTITINQINSHNFEGVDFRRLLSGLFILQTSKKSKEYLTSIYTVILLNLFNGKPENPDFFHNKAGENIIINSTTRIYSFIEDIASNMSTDNIFDINKKLLLTPKMGEICNIITNICKIDDEGNEIEFYAQLWAHETLRVFADKFSNSQQAHPLFEEVKKYSFMEFKHNLSKCCSTFIFSDICKEMDDDSEKYPYIKHESLDQIKKQIQEIYSRESNFDDLPFFTDQLVKDLMKILRVLSLEGGNLLMVTPFKKSAKLMVKIANLLVRAIYHDIEGNQIDFQKNLGPSIIKNTECTIAFDIETTTQQTIYQLTCLANRNYYDFDISQQMKQKIKSRFVALAHQSQKKQQGQNLQNNINTNLNIKPKLADGQDTSRLSQIPNKVQAEFLQICIDCLSEYLHITTSVHPGKIQTTKFLSENMSLIKNMQIVWYEFKDEALHEVTEKMLSIYPKDSIQSDQQFLSKCMKIYEILGQDQKSIANFYKYHDNCCRIHENLMIKLTDQRQQYEQCLEVLNQNLKKIEQHKANSKKIQQHLEEIVKNKEQVSLSMKNAQETGNLQQLQKLESQMRHIKLEKQSVDFQSRECRNLQKMSESFSNLLPPKQDLIEKLRITEEIFKKGQEYSILVESAMLYLNNEDQASYIRHFNEWLKLLNEQQVKQIDEIIKIFSKVYEMEYMKIPGWHNFSPFTQLKGFHFCQNFMQIPESAFGAEPIVVDDKEQILVKLLSKISSPSYPSLKLISYFYDKRQKQGKKQAPLKNTKAEVLALVQKQIFKAINEQKEDARLDDKHELKKGIIILGENNKWQPNRNDVDLLEKKLLRQRRILLGNRVIIRGQTSPNITFHPTKQDLRFDMIQKSMRIQFGDSLVNQNNKIETLLRQHLVIEEQKNEILVERSIQKESPQLVLQKIQATQKQLSMIKNDRHKMMEILSEERRASPDSFLIDWILSFANQSNLWTFQRVLQAYEFIKKCFMEINCSRQDKITTMQKIEESIVANWTNLIKTNLTFDESITLEQLVKFCMPLEQISNLIIVPHEATTQNQIAKLLQGCQYKIHIIDMNITHSYGQYGNVDHQCKNLWIFDKFAAENPHHLSLFMDYFEKNKNSWCPVVIIISNNAQVLKQNQQLNEIFKVKCKTVPSLPIKLSQQLSYVEMEEHKEKKNNQFSKTTKKGQIEDQELSADISYIAENDEEMGKIKQAIKKFLTIFMGARNNYKCYLSIKGIGDRIELAKNYESVKSFLKDMIISLPESWYQLMNDLFSTDSDCEKANQIEALYAQYADIIFAPEIQNNLSDKKQLAIHATEKIEKVLSQLPFAFNCQDFKQTNEPLALWMISEANKLNSKRFIFKKYLQECIQISKANKINFWNPKKSFGFQLPEKEEMVKLCGDFKVIKKGLEMVGLISGIDTSSKDIKFNVTNGQAQSILAIACQSFDCRSYDGFSEKLISLQMMKASKKLKLPLSKLRVTWKIVNQQSFVDELVSGENCLSLNATLTHPEYRPMQKTGNSKDSGSTKILIMIYDPSQTSIPIQQVTKQPKKQKVRKTKQEQVKLNLNQNKTTNIDIGVLLHGSQIGIIKIPKIEDSFKYKKIIEDPTFILF